MDLKKIKILFVVLLSIYAIYFSTSTGLNTSNDGGHIALAKAIYNDHQLTIEKYLDVYIKRPDYAIKDGKIYSDRLPGTALLIIPSYGYANLLNTLGISVSNSDNEIDMVVSSILPPLFGMLSVLLLFWYYHKVLKKKFLITVLCVLVYAFGTLAWLESSHLFSHAPSLFFVSLAVLLVISDFNKSWRFKLIIASFLLGYATLIELQNILFFGPILGYLIYKEKLYLKVKRIQSLKVVSSSILILFVFLGILLFYNYLTFDDITLKSNKYNPFFPEESSFLTSLSGNFVEGIDSLYTSFLNIEAYVNPAKARLNDIPGLFVTSPILLLSSFGFIIYFKKYKLEAILLLSCIFMATLIAALHVTTLVRHIYTINLLLFLPFIFTLEYILTISNSIQRKITLFIVGIIILISILRVWFSTISYWGRNFDNLFLYSEELKLFLIANIPFFIIGIIIYYRKKRTKLIV